VNYWLANMASIPTWQKYDQNDLRQLEDEKL
jgi:hypothetical protein